ncbi:dimethyl sulfoxide reductase chain YnfE [Escherichia coli]|uniref:Dimethyl sulfoxide reductase chain YnfE n=1 Tax=Escherichia coli TaxID=562 RepID=A0A376KTP0_ECOLX|nr:dimethyl sulfoxide reductase chain YnfE [Escherichia coli]
MFGNNPAETRMSGGGITYLLEKAREKSNAKMIVIDPRYTDTAAGREDEWLPIRRAPMPRWLRVLPGY